MFLLLQNLIRSFLIERKDFVFVLCFFLNSQRTKEESFLNDFEATTRFGTFFIHFCFLYVL